ncbi:MAG: four helix bundle protein [Gammaproteobacteria bacterium]|nr:four helix bundle protein [Gammaproteobacteria bacterium]
MLSFKKLDVYRCAIEFEALASEIIEMLPRGHARLIDQLDRASMSVTLNTAEGVGKSTPRDQAKHFTIARGSAMECAAVLDVCLVRHLIDKDRADRGEILLTRIVQMLSKLGPTRTRSTTTTTHTTT